MTRKVSNVTCMDRQHASQADRLVALAQAASLFRAPGAYGKAYATIPVGSHRETWGVTSNGFRTWLSGRFHEETAKVPTTKAIEEALNVIEGKARFDSPEASVAVRIAELDGVYYLDLADSDWNAVRIDGRGWRIVARTPVKFIRPGGLCALPKPVRGGSVDELRAFANVAANDDWALLLAFLVAALRPAGPYPILVLSGEQGSAKSTTARVLRALVDPNCAPLRSEPHGARDLMIAASNAWMLAFDNLSRVHPWLSDALCRLATGGGFATRTLYTDGEEVLFNATRPIMLNGIGELAARSDLLDRSITLTLPMIPEDQRRTEEEFGAAFAEAQPRILGALLNAVSTGMRCLPNVKLERLPRMADFARWVTACEPGLKLQPGAFLRAYAGNRAAANDTAIESASVGTPLLRLMEGRDDWDGTAGALLDEINSDQYSDEKVRQREDWPRTPRGMGEALDRLAPNLRASGIDVTRGREPGGSRTRMIHLKRMA